MKPRSFLIAREAGGERASSRLAIRGESSISRVFIGSGSKVGGLCSEVTSGARGKSGAAEGFPRAGSGGLPSVRPLWRHTSAVASSGLSLATALLTLGVPDGDVGPQPLPALSCLLLA